MSSAVPIAGLPPPNFGGANLLNLAATIDAALSKQPEYPLLADLRLREPILRARHLVLWLIDGLGIEPLQMLAAQSALAGAVRGELDSVFPSSTVPALMTLATGRSPAAHAVPEWYFWVEELGAIYRALALDTRDPLARNAPLADASALYAQASLMARSRRPCFAVLPSPIADSPFSRYAHQGAARVPYGGDENFVDAITRAIDASPDGCYVFAYADSFDHMAHEAGIDSDKAKMAVRQLDRRFRMLAREMATRQALLVVTSNHGFIDTPPHLRLHLDSYPQIAECLERALCGGPRTPFAYVKADRQAEFPAIVERALGAHFVAVPGAELIEAGWFGPDAPDPRLASRIGTHVLLPKNQACLVDHMAGEYLTPLIGVHGGLTNAERRVPVILAGADRKH